jgi:hypothetical protein
VDALCPQQSHGPGQYRPVVIDEELLRRLVELGGAKAHADVIAARDGAEIGSSTREGAGSAAALAAVASEGRALGTEAGDPGGTREGASSVLHPPLRDEERVETLHMAAGDAT